MCCYVLQPCIKLAWDFYNPHRMPAYAESAVRVASVLGGSNSKDYMDVNSLAVAALLQSKSK